MSKQRKTFFSGFSFYYKLSCYLQWISTWFSRCVLMFKVDRMAAVLVGQQRFSRIWHKINFPSMLLLCCCPQFYAEAGGNPHEWTCQLHTDNSHRPTGLELKNFSLLNEAQDWTTDILKADCAIHPYAPNLNPSGSFSGKAFHKVQECFYGNLWAFFQKCICEMRHWSSASESPLKLFQKV